MKNLIKSIAFAAAFFLGSSIVQAWAVGQLKVSEDIYYWLQSTDRMNYYVDRNKIAYAVDKEGQVDFYTLLVPVLKSYDGVQVKDVIERRRWNNVTTEGFENLAGEKNLLEINLLEKTVTLKKLTYINFSQGVIEETEPNLSVEITKLADKHVERRFFDNVITFENSNPELVIKNTKGNKLSEEDKKQLLKDRKKAQKTIEKKYSK